MHDPMTLAFDIRVRKHQLVEIWHVDPEKGGDDNSCGWTFPHLTKYEMALADSLWDNEHDNLRPWFAHLSRYDAIYRICQLFRIHKSLIRPWYKHPRWHIHHWKIQIPFVLYLRRRLFSRCAGCGERFSWRYSPVSTHWGQPRRHWWESEVGVYHHDCYRKREEATHV